MYGFRQICKISRNLTRKSTYHLENTIYPTFTRNVSTVAAETIHITFIDQEGNKVSVPGLIGDTLLNVAWKHKIDIEGNCEGGGAPAQIRRTANWVDIVYGEGVQCFQCHVQIPSKYNSILPEQFNRDIDGLIEVWQDEYTPASRLACQIVLDKRHDGMVVFVPDSHNLDIM